jgi:hypothetical protein
MDGGTTTEEGAMTEPDTTQGAAGEAEGSHASVGGDVERPGGGRTGGETSVDEALGTTPDE